jgi:ATP-dependent helicase Lhr and Lhr-like helicase
MLSRAGPPTAAGRWSLSPVSQPPVAQPPGSPPPEPQPDPTRRAHARAETFLERHGVLTRGALDTERVAGGFTGVYKVLRAMEESGRCRRGYVVEGLGAAQFAVPGAIDRLRGLGQPSEGGAATVILAATDPAQPYGAALPWPPTVGDVRHRPGRKAGALAVLVDGAAVLYIERGGRSLLSFTEDTGTLRAAVRALAGAVHQGWLGALSVERADGEAALGSALGALFREAGFRATPRGLRIRA